MRARLLSLPVLFLATTAAFAGVTDAAPEGAMDVPVNARAKFTFQCASSATGVCHNVLLADSGSVAGRFSLAVGRSRVMYDLPQSLRLCMTDTPVTDNSQCADPRTLAELLAPLQRN